MTRGFLHFLAAKSSFSSIKALAKQNDKLNKSMTKNLKKETKVDDLKKKTLFFWSSCQG